MRGRGRGAEGEVEGLERSRPLDRERERRRREKRRRVASGERGAAGARGVVVAAGVRHSHPAWVVGRIPAAQTLAR